mmetsp:Transcript_900/g.2679  ORF Transcript_900/g.2679 Transcript_900/m.2679 type:complete len:224 (+) Transcript_900:2035-2706(+)
MIPLLLVHVTLVAAKLLPHGPEQHCIPRFGLRSDVGDHVVELRQPPCVDPILLRLLLLLRAFLELDLVRLCRHDHGLPALVVPLCLVCKQFALGGLHVVVARDIVLGRPPACIKNVVVHEAAILHLVHVPRPSVHPGIVAIRYGLPQRDGGPDGVVDIVELACGYKLGDGTVLLLMSLAATGTLVGVERRRLPLAVVRPLGLETHHLARQAPLSAALPQTVSR